MFGTHNEWKDDFQAFYNWAINNGETHCLSEWCDIYNLPYDRVRTRLKLNWTIEKALELDE